jgi:Acyltransferase
MPFQTSELMIDNDYIALRDATARDLLKALGCTRPGWLRIPAERVAMVVMRNFIQQAIEFDLKVARDGLGPASNWFAGRIESDLTIRHDQTIPTDGPLLVVSNHPGLSDTLALFSSIRRPDLRILAEANPFLLALNNVREHLLLLPSTREQKGMTLRPVLRHLRKGGSILTFPRGRIEPDPSLNYQDSLDSLAEWSESVSLLAASIPNLQILPVAVSGVLHPKAQNSLLTRIRRTREGREQVGAFLQLTIPRFRSVNVHVKTGHLLEAGPEIGMRIQDEMTRLIRASTGEFSE